MMVALAIGAVFTAGLAGLSRTISPRVELRATAERVAGDFERARLQARRTGAPVTIAISQSGYVIDALDLSSDWGEAVFTLVEGRADTGVLVVAAEPFATAPAVISLRRDGLSARISLAPASGRVEARLGER
jgi:Tfp pilus assembly protein FimT